MSKKLTRPALAFKELVEFSDSVQVEDEAFNPQPEPPKVNGIIISNKYWTAQFAEAHRLAQELDSQ